MLVKYWLSPIALGNTDNELVVAAPLDGPLPNSTKPKQKR